MCVCASPLILPLSFYACRGKVQRLESPLLPSSRAADVFYCCNPTHKLLCCDVCSGLNSSLLFDERKERERNTNRAIPSDTTASLSLIPHTPALDHHHHLPLQQNARREKERQTRISSLYNYERESQAKVSSRDDDEVLSSIGLVFPSLLLFPPLSFTHTHQSLSPWYSCVWCGLFENDSDDSAGKKGYKKRKLHWGVIRRVMRENATHRTRGQRMTLTDAVWDTRKHLYLFRVNKKREETRRMERWDERK